MTRITAPLVATVVAAAASLVSAAIPAQHHPKRHLFERQAPAGDWPAINTVPPASSLPKAWKDALDDAKSAGKIPDLPRSTIGDDGNPHYPSGSNDEEICNWTLTKCLGANDISDAPKGVWAIAFDDGPSTNSPELYSYLSDQKQSATHFMIGSQILSYPDAFLKANASGGQLAVHTWSHKLQTANSDEEVLGDLAWTMQIIFNMTGRIPNLWRPPQGDIDNRVRAIAEEILGLRTVMWDFDGNDWCLQDDYKTACPADNTIGQSYNSVLNYINAAIAKTGGDRGAIMLAHEINKPSIAIFKEYYPTLSQKGWKPESVGDFNATGYYSNAVDNTSPPTSQTGVIVSGIQSLPAPSSTASGSSSSGSSSSTRSGSMRSSTSSSSAGASTGTAASDAQSGSSSSGTTTSGASHLAVTSLLAAAAASVAAVAAFFSL